MNTDTRRSVEEVEARIIELVKEVRRIEERGKEILPGTHERLLQKIEMMLWFINKDESYIEELENR